MKNTNRAIKAAVLRNAIRRRLTSGDTIIGGSDRTLTTAQCRVLRRRVYGARFTLNGKRVTPAALIHDGVPANWARRIAAMKPGTSIRLDAGNFEFNTVVRGRNRRVSLRQGS